MGIQPIPKEWLKPLLPARILSLGWPDGIEDYDLSGSHMDCVDVKQYKGTELLADLNYPNILGSYDIVLDPGTIEHCFNIGQALMNAAEAVAVGGHIFHGSPVSMVNHGYYNLCPVVLRDFYEANGFEVVNFHLKSSENGQVYSTPAWDRIRVEPETLIALVARRKAKQRLQFPIQAQYR